MQLNWIKMKGERQRIYNLLFHPVGKTMKGEQGEERSERKRGISDAARQC